MRRRWFIGLIGGAVALPFAARAQQPALPVIGFLNGRSATDTVGLAAAFRQGLNEVGFVDGRNVTIEYRWASNQADQLPALAAELVGRPVTVIAAFGTASALAAKAATTTIPTVFVTGDDPIKTGIVASLSRPDGNITGVTFVAATLGTKRLQLLRGLAPQAEAIAVLVDPNAPESLNQAADVEAAARSLGMNVTLLQAGTPGEIEAALARLSQRRIALLVGGSPAFMAGRTHILAVATRYKIPAIGNSREYAAAGSVISYGASITEAHRQGALYIGKLLRGDKPSDLPVQQPTRFEMVINMKAARALGIEIPLTLIALADEVIE